MPELPEVETVRRGLAPRLEGARFERVDLRRPGLRFPFPAGFAARLAGRVVVSLGRRAKYLVAELDDGQALIMHLGMTGRFAVEDAGAAPGAFEPGGFYYDADRLPAHDHVAFDLAQGDVASVRLIYNDVRRFGFMDLVGRGELAGCVHFRAMGVEPTGNAFDAELLARLFAGKATSLKAALLDQRLVSGLGNIYACEALFRAGLPPALAAGAIVTPDGRPTAAAIRLADAIRAVIAEAIEKGGSTLRDYRNADGGTGGFQDAFRVYDREGEPCVTPGCGSTITRFVQSGRSTFWCPRCQV